MFEYWGAGYSTHATLILENRYDKVGRYIGRLEHNPEALDSFKYFCGFMFYFFSHLKIILISVLK